MSGSQDAEWPLAHQGPTRSCLSRRHSGGHLTRPIAGAGAREWVPELGKAILRPTDGQILTRRRASSILGNLSGRFPPAQMAGIGINSDLSHPRTTMRE